LRIGSSHTSEYRTVLDVKLADKNLTRAKIRLTEDSFMAEVGKKENSWKRDLSAFISGKLPDFDQVKEDIGRKINEALQ